MEKVNPQALGVRAIARLWKCAPSYVCQLVERFGLQPLPGGGYDVEQLQTYRKRYTCVGRGQQRYRRHHPSEEIHICIQCGAKYTPAGQRKEDIFPAQDMER